jgi:hypothetical protein
MNAFITKIYAEGIVGGPITNPLDRSYGSFNNAGGGMVGLLNNVLRLVFVVAGIFSLFNFIMAGFLYMNAAGDTKKLEQAWAKIWLTLVGLVIIVGSFVMAAIIGALFFGNAMFILDPQITTP